MNAPSLSESMPSVVTGICWRIRMSPATASVCSRASNGTASTQPEQTSVATRLCRYSPAIEPPPWTTKSISRKPGKGSFQSANVLIGISLRSFVGRRRFLRMPDPWRSGVSIRSIVAALTRSTCLRTSGSSFKCPCLSSAPTKWGIAAFNRFPQMRSAVSQSNTSAAFTASP